VPTSESETKNNPLNITICNSPALLKEPLALNTPVTPVPFFTITKSDLSQQLTMTTTTQTTTQTAAITSTAIAPQHPLTMAELEELLNITMGE